MSDGKFPAPIIQTRRQCSNMFKTLKGKMINLEFHTDGNTSKWRLEKTSTDIEKVKEFISIGRNVMAIFHVQERWFQMEVKIDTTEWRMLECVDKKDNCFVESKNQNMLRVLNVTQGRCVVTNAQTPNRSILSWGFIPQEEWYRIIWRKLKMYHVNPYKTRNKTQSSHKPTNRKIVIKILNPRVK